MSEEETLYLQKIELAEYNVINNTKPWLAVGLRQTLTQTRQRYQDYLREVERNERLALEKEIRERQNQDVYTRKSTNR
jgi:hypothetical protein